MRRFATAVALATALGVLGVGLAPAAGATPPPQRPHPHRKPWPVTMTINTVPAVAGVRFVVDDTTVTTDRSGVARFTAEHDFAPHTLRVVDSTVTRPDERFRFLRWSGQRDPAQAFRPSVSGLPLRANYTVTAAFSTQYAVRLRVADSERRPIAAARLSGLQLKGSTGQIVPVPASSAGTTLVWLDGQVPVFQRSRLSARPVTWALHSLEVDRSNALGPGQQRFNPAARRDVTVVVPLFTLTVSAHEALFGHGEPGRAAVRLPNGAVRTVTVDARQRVVISGLPRGSYNVRLTDAKGVAFDKTVSLSHDKRVDLLVISRLDLGLVAGLVVLLAVVVLVAGRPRLRGAAGRTVRGGLRRVRR